MGFSIVQTLTGFDFDLTTVVLYSILYSNFGSLDISHANVRPTNQIYILSLVQKPDSLVHCSYLLASELRLHVTKMSVHF